jgi:cell division protein FtsL
MKKRFFKNKPKTYNLPLKRSGFLWILVFVLLGVHVLFAVDNSSTGVKIALLEEEIHKLEEENENLSKDLLNTTSLTKLNENAESLGYLKIEKAIYLQTGQAQAKAN